MIRKLDLFLSNHSRFPVKQILMKASCSKKRDREANTNIGQSGRDSTFRIRDSIFILLFLCIKHPILLSPSLFRFRP